jgi:hypothetical protein
LAEVKLLKNYEGLQLYDPHHDANYTVLSFNFEFVHDRKSCGWSFLVAPPGYVADGEHDDDIGGFMIDNETAGMIADIEQNPELNVHIVCSAANDDDNEDDA